MTSTSLRPRSSGGTYHSVIVSTPGCHASNSEFKSVCLSVCLSPPPPPLLLFTYSAAALLQHQRHRNCATFFVSVCVYIYMSACQHPYHFVPNMSARQLRTLSPRSSPASWKTASALPSLWKPRAKRQLASLFCLLIDASEIQCLFCLLIDASEIQCLFCLLIDDSEIQY